MRNENSPKLSRCNPHEKNNNPNEYLSRRTNTVGNVGARRSSHGIARCTRITSCRHSTRTTKESNKKKTKAKHHDGVTTKELCYGSCCDRLLDEKVRALPAVSLSNFHFPRILRMSGDTPTYQHLHDYISLINEDSWEVYLRQ